LIGGDRMEKNSQEKYDKIRNTRNKLIFRSLILILFLIGINIFAWFTFISKASLSLTGDVVSWDVEFNSDGSDATVITVDIVDMKPGMTDYEKEVVVHNLGEVIASVDYKIEELKILGSDVDVSDNDTVISKLESYYPFIIKFESTKDDLSTDDYSQFTVKATWSYEEDKYYQLDELYDFDETFTYYKLSNEEYAADSTITSSNYITNRSNLYLFKDDADTYFGEKCGEYEESTGNACIQMKIQLVAQQKSS